ncbi:uncharacterized protein BDV14DRAFT_167560, partial [Aspergillus stella-maris]|uniref:uncharacterized protein n=1 Tax=Aspergillus stella-maris TaxID=1810926 RepID=UPI003CCDADE6
MFFVETIPASVSAPRTSSVASAEVGWDWNAGMNHGCHLLWNALLLARSIL